MAATQTITRHKASKSKLRRVLLAEEIETRVEVPHGADAADNSANAQLGDVPCLLGTLASQWKLRASMITKSSPIASAESW